jgi:hypothetical protein
MGCPTEDWICRFVRGYRNFSARRSVIDDNAELSGFSIIMRIHELVALEECKTGASGI